MSACHRDECRHDKCFIDKCFRDKCHFNICILYVVEDDPSEVKQRRKAQRAKSSERTVLYYHTTVFAKSKWTNISAFRTDRNDHTENV